MDIDKYPLVKKAFTSLAKDDYGEEYEETILEVKITSGWKSAFKRAEENLKLLDKKKVYELDIKRDSDAFELFADQDAIDAVGLLSYPATDEILDSIQITKEDKANLVSILCRFFEGDEF
jgi:hypothetical protein